MLNQYFFPTEDWPGALPRPSVGKNKVKAKKRKKLDKTHAMPEHTAVVVPHLDPIRYSPQLYLISPSRVRQFKVTQLSEHRRHPLKLSPEHVPVASIPHDCCCLLIYIYIFVILPTL